jgi:hypothetical protein
MLTAKQCRAEGAKQYRAKAAEYTELLKVASLPAETCEIRRLERSFLTLAENEEWMADNLEKTNSPGADDNLYDNILLPPCHEKSALGCLGAADPMQSTEILTKIQQVFDDAGFKGSLSQTATLRGQIAQFLEKHKDDDIR